MCTAVVMMCLFWRALSLQPVTVDKEVSRGLVCVVRAVAAQLEISGAGRSFRQDSDDRKCTSKTLMMG
jgi:hypothetical protein